MSVNKGLRINREYYRGNNKKVFAFLNHLTYLFGNYISFKGPYVPTTYHSHLAQGGPSDVLIHLLLLYTYSSDRPLPRGMVHVRWSRVVVLYHNHTSIQYIGHLTS